jgi:hypothetical protein
MYVLYYVTSGVNNLFSIFPPSLQSNSALLYFRQEYNLEDYVIRSRDILMIIPPLCSFMSFNICAEYVH